MNVVEWLKNDFLMFDGAMGTMLQNRGLKAGGLPELLNIDAPGTVTRIHSEYVQAGADVITANTFGAHELKLGMNGKYSVEAVISAGIKCARDSGARFTALDAGPLGQLIEPLGALSFEGAYEVYRRMMTAGEQSGADLIIIETISDLYEAKAAILAARENTKLPVFCTMTFEESGRTFLGCDPLTAAVTLGDLGVQALGVNCSVGPEKLGCVAETMLKYSPVPVIAQANAGLPELRGGAAYYGMPPEVYAGYAVEMAGKGVRILGGCCGTTPEHIRKVKQGIKGMKPVDARPLAVNACTSGRRTVILDGTQRVGILKPGDIDDLIDHAMELEEDGADVLILPEIGDSDLLVKAIRAIQQIASAPLQIQSGSPEALKAGLRAYNGKPVRQF